MVQDAEHVLVVADLAVARGILSGVNTVAYAAMRPVVSLTLLYGCLCGISSNMAVKYMYIRVSPSMNSLNSWRTGMSFLGLSAVALTWWPSHCLWTR